MARPAAQAEGLGGPDGPAARAPGATRRRAGAGARSTHDGLQGGLRGLRAGHCGPWHSTARQTHPRQTPATRPPRTPMGSGMDAGVHWAPELVARRPPCCSAGRSDRETGVTPSFGQSWNQSAGTPGHSQLRSIGTVIRPRPSAWGGQHLPRRADRAPEGRDRRGQLRILVDWSSVEVFGGGEAVITDQVSPTPAAAASRCSPREAPPRSTSCARGRSGLSGGDGVGPCAGRPGAASGARLVAMQAFEGAACGRKTGQKWVVIPNICRSRVMSWRS
ncbi:hypothetical protein HNR57_007150 [Streptomyces paradoxus]|uniref:Glycosyl hydrolase family 32 C-terminal domain-containing protein n=1 Tax=Streptomyces paradoxus TaxID=66375 RepID=A0A7W9WLB6_9ACTN|nr:hypothetical protein [Streptomyces paradoxus]